MLKFLKKIFQIILHLRFNHFHYLIVNVARYAIAVPKSLEDREPKLNERVKRAEIRKVKSNRLRTFS